MPAVKAPEQPATKQYKVGNALRGYFVGDFASSIEAWEWLRERFWISYPGIRRVFMLVYETNQFGYTQWLQCNEGWTEEPKHSVRELLDKGFEWH